jgi:hypothetical protein
LLSHAKPFITQRLRGRVNIFRADNAGNKSAERFVLRVPFIARIEADNTAWTLIESEYWDIERKRYPQYEHCAVLVAEDITSRFLNVISLFNGSIPLIALQMQALKVGEHTTLIFTKVLDELSRGLVDEDEDAEAAPADRTYWEKRGTKATVQLADELLGIVHEIDPSLELRYNRYYIGLSTKEGQPFNFAQFRPRKSTINLEIHLPRSDDIDKKIDESGVEALDYETKWERYPSHFAQRRYRKA